METVRSKSLVSQHSQAAMKEQCASGTGPKEIISSVSAMVGGVTHASDACELPRSEQQVSYIKQRQKKAPVVCSSSK